MKYINLYNEMRKELAIDPAMSLRQFVEVRGCRYHTFIRWTKHHFGLSPNGLRNAIVSGKCVKTLAHVDVSVYIALTPEGVKLLNEFGMKPSFAKMYDNLRYVTSGVGIADFTFENIMLELDYEVGKPKCQHNIVLPERLQYGVHFRRTTQTSKKIMDKLHDLNLFKPAPPTSTGFASSVQA